MCSTRDITHRCNLGNQAFKSFAKVWMTSKIPLETKLKVYEAQVVSVIMYNANCWAAPKTILESLDICHRKHLRKLLNIKWPRSMITNKTLYARCNTTPLSERAALARCKMLGHILRSLENSLAQAALYFAVGCLKDLPGRVGRHRINLLQVLKKDVEQRDLNLNDYPDILELRQIASNRNTWRNMFY